MPKEPILNFKSLKDQVYEYLRSQMERGEIRPGASINMDELSQKLGVSKTPLRDALLRLEMEDFVTIQPRRGVKVKQLTLGEIKDYYEIIGALENTAILSVFDKLKDSDIDKMRRFLKKMKEAIRENNFNLYYKYNINAHNVFLDLCPNRKLVRIVDNLKKRLYDFPRQEGFVKEWEEASIREHEKLLELIEQGKKEKAANFMRDVHWSYEVQEKYLKKYYQKALESARKDRRQ